MQTFLPFPDYAASASCLDYRRLGKQRVEAWQILETLATGLGGWAKHPAIGLWRGHAHDLSIYGEVVCREWIRRGYEDNMLDRFLDFHAEDTGPPYWMGWDPFHRAHRSNLLRKDPEFYGKYDWRVPDNLDYIWPDTDTNKETPDGQEAKEGGARTPRFNRRVRGRAR